MLPAAIIHANYKGISSQLIKPSTSAIDYEIQNLQ